MHQALAVGVFERLGQRDGQAQRLGHGERPGAQPLGQAAALHEVHHDIRLAVVQVDIEDINDVWVRERGDHLSLAQKALARLGVGRE